MDDKKILRSLALFEPRAVCTNYRIDQDNTRVLKRMDMFLWLSINYYGALINFTGFIRQIKINYHIIESNPVETNYTNYTRDNDK